MTAAAFVSAFPDESEFVERKKGAGRAPITESVVSFSNTDGGLILIGVSNEGDVVGRELTQGLEDDLHEMVGHVRDPGRYSISPLIVDGRPITVLAIAKRSDGFSQTSNGRVLVRRGTLDVALFGAELREFINARSLERFESADAGIALDEVPRALVRRVAEAFKWSGSASFPQRLVENGLATQTSAGFKLTVAGALHLLPRPDEKLGKAYIEVLRYREGASTYDRRIQIDGPLREQVEKATQLVSDEVGDEVVVLGVHRHELPRLPRRVLREAIANAVAHRSYELDGTCIRIEIRPDAVVITSPGSLPEPVTVENMRDQASARNPTVIRVLRAFNLAEDSGEGVDVMQDEMRDELLDAPIFVDSGTTVSVTLPVRSAVAPSERAWVREVEQRGLIEPSDRILLVHAARGEVLTNARVRELVGVDKDQARIASQRLRDAGFLVQRGERGGATYVLDRSLAPPAGLRLGQSELEDLIIEMASEGPLANADVRTRTGLDRGQTLELLAKLVQDGRLERYGQRRGSRYRVVPSGQQLLPLRDR
ncbi:MAG TPA: ATP-binding protein [Solirubrobacteraceae bacterium]|jgi:ATP-dependent DNA helicase RecG|nr:ATP-binding protein [Solirubrobacteraceae bacterium]